MQICVAANFPLLPMMLRDHPRRIIILNNKMVSISKYPVVQGYLMEAELFVQSSLEITIPLNDCSTAVLIFHGYVVNYVEEVIDDMAVNVLYRLQSSHPIIDGVGLLMNEVDEKWLVTI